MPRRKTARQKDSVDTRRRLAIIARNAKVSPSMHHGRLGLALERFGVRHSKRFAKEFDKANK